MPPKKAAAKRSRSRAAPGARAKRGKKQDTEQQEDEKKSPPKKAKKAAARPKVNPAFPLGGAVVHEDFDCTLNQTNISQNNNKFYKIQVLEMGSSFICFTHWGRVGEPGQNKVERFSVAEEAITTFEAKFHQKTANKWHMRDGFVAKTGKYTLIKIDHDAEESDEGGRSDTAARDAAGKKYAPSKLAKSLQEFIRLIFSEDMFRSAMKSMEIDTKKMPLGKLHEDTIREGFKALEDIEAALNGRAGAAELGRLSSRFYTLIPHDFGRRVPPSINSPDLLQKKYDMMAVLGDIAKAQEQEAEQVKKRSKKKGEEKLEPHPLDTQYDSLMCDLAPLNPKSTAYKMIETYINNTGGYAKLIDVFEVNRHSEGERYEKHEGLDNRKLLWHGTNVAVVAAILGSGLRIMPHSGGRVGKGIYLASENSKSAGYVCPANDRVGIMFLVEAALGRPHEINRDCPSICKPPSGYDSVVARGFGEPDPAKDKTLKLDDRDVTIPQGKVVTQKQWSGSSFSQSEYLLYQESQCRLRYVLRMKF